MRIKASASLLLFILLFSCSQKSGHRFVLEPTQSFAEGLHGFAPHFFEAWGGADVTIDLQSGGLAIRGSVYEKGNIVEDRFRFISTMRKPTQGTIAVTISPYQTSGKSGEGLRTVISTPTGLRVEGTVPEPSKELQTTRNWKLNFKTHAVLGEEVPVFAWLWYAEKENGKNGATITAAPGSIQSAVEQADWAFVVSAKVVESLQ